jgi:hypothetical protein
MDPKGIGWEGIDISSVFIVVYLTMFSASRPRIASDSKMIYELERIWKETIVASSRYCPGICPN